MPKKGDPSRGGGDPSKKTAVPLTENADAAKREVGRKKAITAAYEAALPVAQKAHATAEKAGEDFLLRGHIGRSIGLLRKEHGEDAAHELVQRLEEAGITDRKGVPKTKDDPKKKGGSAGEKPVITVSKDTVPSGSGSIDKGVPATQETEARKKIDLTITKEHVERPDPKDPIKGRAQIEAKTSEGETIRRSWKLTALDIKKSDLRTADDEYLFMLARKKLSDEVDGADFVGPSSTEKKPLSPDKGGAPPQRVTVEKSRPAVVRVERDQVKPTREIRSSQENDEGIQYLRVQIEFSTAGLEKNHAAEKALTRRKTLLTKKDKLSPEATAALKSIEGELQGLYPKRLEIKNTLERALSIYGALRFDKDAKLARIREDISVLKKKDALTQDEQAVKKSLEKEFDLLKSQIEKMEAFTNAIDKRLQAVYSALNFQAARATPERQSPSEKKAVFTDTQIEELRADYKNSLGKELVLLRDIEEKKKQKNDLTNKTNSLGAGKEKTKAIADLKTIERELARLETDLEKWGKKRSNVETTLRAAGGVDDETPKEMRVQGIVSDLSVRKRNMTRKYEEIVQHTAQIDRTKLSDPQKQLVATLLRATKETVTYLQSPALQHENVSDIGKLNEINNKLIPLNGAINNAAMKIEKLARQYPLLKAEGGAARLEAEKRPPTGYFHNGYHVSPKLGDAVIYRIISEISQNQLDSQARLGNDTDTYLYYENPRARLSDSPSLPSGLDTVERFELAKLVRRDAETFIKSDASFAVISDDIKKTANPDTYAAFFYTLDVTKNSLTIIASHVDRDGKPVAYQQTFSFDDPEGIQSDDIRIVLHRIPLKAGEKYNIATLLDPQNPLSDVLLSAIREHCKDTIVRSLFDANPSHYIGAMHGLSNVRDHKAKQKEAEEYRKTRKEHMEKMANADIRYVIAHDGEINRQLTIPGNADAGSLRLVDTSKFDDTISSEAICEALKEEDEKIRNYFYTTDAVRQIGGGFIQDTNTNTLTFIIPDYTNKERGGSKKIIYVPSAMWRIGDGLPLDKKTWNEIMAGTKNLTDLSPKERDHILDHVSELHISELARREALARLTKKSATGGVITDSLMEIGAHPIRYVEERGALKKELEEAQKTITKMALDREAQQTIGKKIFRDIVTTISNLVERIDAVEESASKSQKIQTTENAPTREEISGVLQLINEVREKLQDKARKQQERMREIREQLANMKDNESLKE